MKTNALIAILFLIILSLAVCTQGADVKLSLSIDADARLLEFDSLIYRPATVVTNMVYEWSEFDVVTTNGLFSGGTVETNTVRQQLPVTQVISSPAIWEAPFVYTLAAGETLVIGDALTAVPKRGVLLDVTLTLTPEQLDAVLGSSLYELTIQSAQAFGSVPVKGELSEILRSVVLSGLAGGVE